MGIAASEKSLVIRVGIGFALVLLLMVALVVVSLVRVAEINQRMRVIVEDNNVKVDLAYAMKNALRERAITMHTIVLQKDAFEQSELFVQFGDLGVSFVDARAQLVEKVSSPEGKALLNDMQVLTKETQPLVAQAVDLAMSNRQGAALALIQGKITPKQGAIANMIDALIDLHKQQTELAFAHVAQAYADTRVLMLGLGGLGGGLGIMIAVVVLRNTVRQAKQLQHQALYDGLTGLPNRRLFTDRLELILRMASREKRVFALLALDLDRFKEINDSLGHHAGDEVLRGVAERVNSCLRESDTVARMGGDEFTILLPTTAHPEGAIEVARKIHEAMKTPLAVSGRMLEANASIGIALFPAHGSDAVNLMRHADAAMYLAKRSQGGFHLYSVEEDKESDDHLNLQSELRQALERNELVLHYQPKIDFETSRISGVEALVRWQHPQQGLLAPDKFIALAEKSGLIKRLTLVVLRMALQQCMIWRQEGHELSIAVNVSPLNVQDPEFPGQVEAMLAELKVPPALLELEMTESAVMSEPKRAIACIERLGALGVQVSIDDFGTGYSSMTYLKQLMIAKIKIDRSFVKDMVTNHNDNVIVRSSVELGHNLGLKVIAEGVEDQASWDRLKEMGCDSAQGYFMSRPLTVEQLADWMQRAPWKPKSST